MRLEDFSKVTQPSIMSRVYMSVSTKNTGKISFLIKYIFWQLKNRKYPLCLYLDGAKLDENEKCSVKTNRRRPFPKLLRIPSSFHECVNNSVETPRKYFAFFFRKRRRHLKRKETA